MQSVNNDCFILKVWQNSIGYCHWKWPSGPRTNITASSGTVLLFKHTMVTSSLNYCLHFPKIRYICWQSEQNFFRWYSVNWICNSHCLLNFMLLLKKNKVISSWYCKLFILTAHTYRQYGRWWDRHDRNHRGGSRKYWGDGDSVFRPGWQTGWDRGGVLFKWRRLGGGGRRCLEAKFKSPLKEMENMMGPLLVPVYEVINMRELLER